MHTPLPYLIMTALIIQPAAAQERRSGPAAADKAPAVTLGDMETRCHAGSRRACDDADQLRAAVNDRMRAQAEARGGSRPEASDIARPVRQGDTQR